jgi:2-polyprenyl-3-methyl-5-hydroxy-6-metoxy-1,4-benzoquinol methylase
MKTKQIIMSDGADSERFQNEADKYAAYLETPEGRLRLDLAFANLQGFLPQSEAKRPMTALDIGGGTGALSLRLARLGFHVTVLDSSLPMLGIAKRTAGEGRVAEKIELKQGDADHLAKMFSAEAFDLILCHNVLEFVESPTDVLRSAAGLMRDSSAILSVVVRNQAGEVLKAAIQTGDLAAAENNLTSDWGNESLYGGKVRLFSPDTLQAALTASSLTVIALRGVRILSDYLPPRISRNAEYDQIFELERKLGSRAEFAAIARYTHCIARCAAPVRQRVL